LSRHLRTPRDGHPAGAVLEPSPPGDLLPGQTLQPPVLAPADRRGHKGGTLREELPPDGLADAHAPLPCRQLQPRWNDPWRERSLLRLLVPSRSQAGSSVEGG